MSKSEHHAAQSLFRPFPLSAQTSIASQTGIQLFARLRSERCAPRFVADRSPYSLRNPEES